tara:strand:+ start:53947 stop:54222 length:276 start_codon:yes stop_codon:yes gene_type:complete
MTDKKEKLTEIIDNMMWIGDSVSDINEACDTMIDHWFPMFTEKDKMLFKYACVQDTVEKCRVDAEKAFGKDNVTGCSNIYTEWADKLGNEL